MLLCVIVCFAVTGLAYGVSNSTKVPHLGVRTNKVVAELGFVFPMIGIGVPQNCCINESGILSRNIGHIGRGQGFFYIGSTPISLDGSEIVKVTVPLEFFVRQIHFMLQFVEQIVGKRSQTFGGLFLDLSNKNKSGYLPFHFSWRLSYVLDGHIDGHDTVMNSWHPNKNRRNLVYYVRALLDLKCVSGSLECILGGFCVSVGDSKLAYVENDRALGLIKRLGHIVELETINISLITGHKKYEDGHDQGGLLYPVDWLMMLSDSSLAPSPWSDNSTQDTQYERCFSLLLGGVVVILSTLLLCYSCEGSSESIPLAACVGLIGIVALGLGISLFIHGCSSNVSSILFPIGFNR